MVFDELDSRGLLVGLGCLLFMFWSAFIQSFNAWDNIPLFYKVLVVLAAPFVAYFVTVKMLDN